MNPYRIVNILSRKMQANIGTEVATEYPGKNDIHGRKEGAIKCSIFGVAIDEWLKQLRVSFMARAARIQRIP